MTEEKSPGLADKLAITTSKAARPGMLGRFQFNLATKLAIAQFNPDRLQQIAHYLEAFTSLSPEEREIIEPDAEERTRHRMRYEICTSLSNMVPSGHYNDGTPKFCIPWSFGRNVAPAYFRLFYHLRPSERIVFRWWNGFEWKTDESRSWPEDAWKMLVEGNEKMWDYWYQVLDDWTAEGTSPNWTLGMKSEFVNVTMPVAEKLGRSIVEKFIDPSVWEEAMKAIRGGPEGVKGDGDRRVA